MNTTLEEKFKSWAYSLQEGQKIDVMWDLFVECSIAESVRFCIDPDNISPYWEASGEPLLEGQTTWLD